MEKPCFEIAVTLKMFLYMLYYSNVNTFRYNFEMNIPHFEEEFLKTDGDFDGELLVCVETTYSDHKNVKIFYSPGCWNETLFLSPFSGFAGGLFVRCADKRSI